MPWDQEFLKKFAPSEDQWKCPVCLVLNDKANEKCRSCENPNPNAKPRAQKRKASETEESASKVAKTNNPGITACNSFISRSHFQFWNSCIYNYFYIKCF